MPNHFDPAIYPRVETGRAGGGRHVFVAPCGAGNFVGVLPGVDSRGAGGYVILPPSLHVSGKTYAWKVLPNGVLPPAPAALMKLLTTSPRRSTSTAHRNGTGTGTGTGTGVIRWRARQLASGHAGTTRSTAAQPGPRVVAARVTPPSSLRIAAAAR